MRNYFVIFLISISFDAISQQELRIRVLDQKNNNKVIENFAAYIFNEMDSNTHLLGSDSIFQIKVPQINTFLILQIDKYPIKVRIDTFNISIILYYNREILNNHYQMIWINDYFEELACHNHSDYYDNSNFHHLSISRMNDAFPRGWSPCYILKN